MSLEARLAQVEQRLVAAEKLIQQLKTSRLTGATAGSQCAPASTPNLEPCSLDTARVAEVRKWCKDNGLYSALLQWVPSEYYTKSLQWRRNLLHADSIHHLCKSIVLVNTHCSRTDCLDPKNSLYYVIVYQYVERFDTEMITRIVKDWNPGVGKKKFNFRLAPGDVSEKITGFHHGGVVPFCTTVSIPVIMSSTILSLAPRYIWVGAGHIDCKLKVDIDEFMKVVRPEVASFTVPLTDEELLQIAE